MLDLLHKPIQELDLLIIVSRRLLTSEKHLSIIQGKIIPPTERSHHHLQLRKNISALYEIKIKRFLSSILCLFVNKKAKILEEEMPRILVQAQRRMSYDRIHPIHTISNQESLEEKLIAITVILYHHLSLNDITFLKDPSLKTNLLILIHIWGLPNQARPMRVKI